MSSLSTIYCEKHFIGFCKANSKTRFTATHYPDLKQQECRGATARGRDCKDKGKFIVEIPSVWA